MFQPQYHISSRLLATIKRVAVQIHELNERRLADDASAALKNEALALSAAAAARSIGRPGPQPDARRLLFAGSPARRPAEQAILNYGRTMSTLGTTPAADFDLGLLLRIHYRLSQGLLPEEQRGRLRREAMPPDRALSDGRGYRPPGPQALPRLVWDLVAFSQENQARLDPVVLAGLFHGQLLRIQPFAAGNMMVAWLTTRILLSSSALRRSDLLVVEDSSWPEKGHVLSDLGLEGDDVARAHTLDFTPWLERFAEDVSAALVALEKRQKLHRASPATTLRPHHQAILDYIDEHGFITDKRYARLTDRAKATRSLDFKKLLELDLIVREGRGRGTFYRRKS